MNKQLQSDFQHFDSILDKARKQSEEYLKGLHERPVSSNPPSTPITKLPSEGLGAENALNLFNQAFDPFIVGASGPRYWGYVTGGTTPASIIGDWLASVYDQNTQAVVGQGDISANIEQDTIRLLLDLLDLPDTFLGGFVTGATMSNFTCLAVARQWAGKQMEQDVAKEGVTETIPVLSATPHSSVVKSLAMLGMGSKHITPVPVMKGNREAISIPALEKKLEALDGHPAILVSSGGTVNTVDFDDFEAIARLKKDYNFWWHIDAAFGGFAACSSTHNYLVNGWEQADSITVDGHKWLNVPYESAVFFVKEQHKILQTETFQNSDAPYLGNPLENFNYLNFLPENSRRLKALPAWFTLVAYGKEGYRDIVDGCILLAQQFGNMLQQNEMFELLAPVRLNNVCFTLAGDPPPEQVDRFLYEVNATGKVFMTPTTYRTQRGIRASLVNWRTDEEDLELVMNVMLSVINSSRA